MKKKHIKAQISSVRLAIDIGTELQLEIVNVSARFKSELIGMETSQYLIAKMPMIVDDSFEEKCSKFKGAEVICRYLYRGTIFGFRSNLLGIISAPARLLFVKYPNEVEEHNVRKNERISCMLPGKIKIGSHILDATVLDLSVSGVLVSVVDNKKEADSFVNILTETDELEFLLQLPGEPKALVLPSIRKVVRKDDSRLNIGLQFHDIGDQGRYIISQFIDAAKSLQS
ncbi:MAG: flagellar brake protein [Candidatus Anammoxibacter sp.]